MVGRSGFIVEGDLGPNKKIEKKYKISLYSRKDKKTQTVLLSHDGQI